MELKREESEHWVINLNLNLNLFLPLRNLSSLHPHLESRLYTFSRPFPVADFFGMSSLTYWLHSGVILIG